MLPIGHQLGAYRIDRWLGAGGIATVYQATHIAMATRHALKALDQPHRAKREVRESWRRQAQHMFHLGLHPHIVRATDLVDTAETMALVFDLADGGDLATALYSQAAPLAWPAAWQVLEPIVSAVAYAHDRGFVHGDLHPENILLVAGGEWPGVPVVTGFADPEAVAGPRRPLAWMGSELHRSPEHHAWSAPIGPASDVWALGMLAWRLVRGCLPLAADAIGLRSRLYSGHVELPRLSGVPRYVADTVAAALHIDPSQRPQDAAQLAAGLTGSKTANERLSGACFRVAQDLVTVSQDFEDEAVSAVWYPVWQAELAAFRDAVLESADDPAEVRALAQLWDMPQSVAEAVADEASAGYAPAPNTWSTVPSTIDGRLPTAPSTTTAIERVWWASDFPQLPPDPVDVWRWPVEFLEDWPQAEVAAHLDAKPSGAHAFSLDIRQLGDARVMAALHRLTSRSMCVLELQNYVDGDDWDRDADADSEMAQTATHAAFVDSVVGQLPRALAAWVWSSHGLSASRLPAWPVHQSWELGVHLDDDIADAELAEVAALPNLTRLTLTSTTMTDAKCASLQRLRRLRDLDIVFCDNLTDRGLAHIVSLATLQRLTLVACPALTYAALEYVGHLRQLRHCRISSCMELPAGRIRPLARLPVLQHLGLGRGTALSDDGLADVSQIQSLASLRVHDSAAVTDVGLAHLRQLPELRLLDLEQGLQVTEDGLAAHVASLTNLTALGLRACPGITDRGLASLGSLSRLEWLDLLGCMAITDAGVASLSAFADLGHLALSLTRGVTPRGLHALARLPSLQHLTLGDCYGLTTKGIAHLTALQGLTTLALSRGHNLTDASLALVRGLPSLQALHLQDCPLLTDDSLTTLASLPALRNVSLRRCPSLTVEGVRLLRVRRPDLQVFNPPY
jgi:hypothetical protein